MKYFILVAIGSAIALVVVALAVKFVVSLFRD
jgi:hypothetical protein